MLACVGWFAGGGHIFIDGIESKQHCHVTFLCFINMTMYN